MKDNLLQYTSYEPLDDNRRLVNNTSRSETRHDPFKINREHAYNNIQRTIKYYSSHNHSPIQTHLNQKKKKPTSKFKERLAELDILRIIVRSYHPQTNGKLERLFGEIQRKLLYLKEIMQRTSLVDLFIENYNYSSHMSLKDDKETQDVTYIRKQSGEKYHVC